MVQRVFITPVSAELAAYVQAVSAALEKLGINSDSLPSEALDEALTGTDLLKAYEATLAATQAFIGIYGGDYGEPLNDSGLSLGEWLYNAAERAQLPRFIYIIAPTQQSEPPSGLRGAAMRLFMDRLRAENDLVRSFSSPQDLSEKISFDIVRHSAMQPQKARYNRRHVLLGLALLLGLFALAVLLIGLALI